MSENKPTADEKQAYDTVGAYAEAEMIKLNKQFYDDLLATKDSWTFVKRETIRPNEGIAVYVGKIKGHNVIP